MKEAESDHQSHQPLCKPPTETKLRAAKQKLEQAERASVSEAWPSEEPA